MRLTETIKRKQSEKDWKKAKEKDKKKDAEAAREAKKQADKQAKEEAAAAQERHLRRMAGTMHTYQQSGADGVLEDVAKAFGGVTETVWDTKHERYGKQLIWNKKLHGETRGEHYMHPGGFFTPGWDWGPKIGEFRGKAITVIADAQYPEWVEVRGRWRRWRVAVDDKEKLDQVLGKAFRRPMKFKRVERAK